VQVSTSVGWRGFFALCIVMAGLAQLAQIDPATASTVFTPPDSYNGVAMPGDCSIDVGAPMQAWLQSLPPQSTADLGNRCYQVDYGIRLMFPQGLVIDGGIFNDPTTTSGPNRGHGTPHGLPVFAVVGGSNVTFENQTFIGADAHGYNPKVAFQHAIQLQGTIGATISNIKIRKLFGDGIDLEPLRGGSDHKSGGIINPAENISISDVSILGTGRNGITMASVNGVTVTNVSMTNIGRDAFDLEADASNEGAKNVLINGCTYNQLFNIKSSGPRTGPITVENCMMQRHSSGGWALNIYNPSGLPDAGPIAFNNDLFLCGASVYVACFNLVGATALTVENSTARLGFPGDAIHEPPYSAKAHTNVSFTDDTVSGYGRCCKVAANSTVAVSGGNWIQGVVLASTYTILSQSNGSVAYGAESADVFTVNVTAQSGPKGAPAGLVTVADTATTTTICSFTLAPATGNAATGSCSPTDFAFPGGTSFTSVTATYDGDNHHWASMSAPQNFSVSSAPATPTAGPRRSESTFDSMLGTSLSVSTDTVAYGSEGAAIFTASVSGLPGGDPPLGTVTVTNLNDGSTICSAGLTPGGFTISYGVCTASDTQFPVGTDLTVAAVWNGDNNYSGSDSSDQSLAVVAGTSATTLSQTTDAVSYGSESADNLTVSVTGQPDGPAPTGPVQVEDASTGDVICTVVPTAVTDDASTGSCNPSDDQFPWYTTFTSVRADYGGDGNYSPSSSSPDQSFTVAGATSTTSATADGPGATTCDALSGKAVSPSGSLTGCTAATTGGSGHLTGSGVVDTVNWANGGTTTFRLNSHIVNKSDCASGAMEIALKGTVTKSTGAAAGIKGRVSAHLCFTGTKPEKVSLLTGTVFKF